ncbi:hypothetical protein [Pseudobutyrivibrio sp. MD2005]|uniref:hypothetical protein n=1 Tax=Pseudobutyrivibrio sp. MD2005 TaxID=1410616 RepID=UPI0004841E8A|nr:hypothetical protein [Pseudobutyrivibrio sp. MD2005]
MRFNYTYSLKYSNGKTYTQNPAKEQMGIEASDEEYRKVVSGVLSGTAISKIEGISELLYKMNNPLGIFDNPAEEMKIYREDGSYINIRSALGKVYIKSSRNRAEAMSMEVETFLGKLGMPCGW